MNWFSLVIDRAVSGLCCALLQCVNTAHQSPLLSDAEGLPFAIKPVLISI